MTPPPLIAAALGTLLAATAAAAAAPRLAVEEAFPGLRFREPVAMVQEPGEAGRWYVAEKGGRVLVVRSAPAAPEPTVFVDLSDRVESGPAEAGLLGIALHPAFARNGVVFLSYTAPERGRAPLVSRISRFRTRDRGATLDPASEEVVLSLEQPYANHNGGCIAFGPDGFLYAGFGDGGSAGDPHGNGQNSNTLLGKILRIDVDRGAPYAIPADNPFARGGGRPEVYALGLRNPWRFSFDRATGELWAADVGQNAWEEVDRVRKGGNYGWNVREGAHCYKARRCRTAGLLDPVAEYSHKDGIAVTGGYVYRGRAIPGLAGTYLYGDYGSGKVWGLSAAAPRPAPTLLLESGLSIASFAEGRDGEVYLLDFRGGGVLRVVGR